MKRAYLIQARTAAVQALAAAGHGTECRIAVDHRRYKKMAQAGTAWHDLARMGCGESSLGGLLNHYHVERRAA